MINTPDLLPEVDKFYFPKKVLRFADDPLRDTLSGYVNHIHTRNEKARVEGIYYRAKREMDAAAASAFESVSGYDVKLEAQFIRAI